MKQNISRLARRRRKVRTMLKRRGNAQALKYWEVSTFETAQRLAEVGAIDSVYAFLRACGATAFDREGGAL